MLDKEETVAAAVEKAREIHEQLNNNTTKRNSESGDEHPDSTKRSALDGGDTNIAHATTNITIRLPKNIVPIVIGPKGERIANIQHTTGANILIDKTPCPDDSDEQECKISGTLMAVEEARQLLTEIVSKHNDQVSAAVSEEMMIPSNKVGLIIGQRGVTISALKNKSGADLKVNQTHTLVTGEDKPLIISGTRESVDQAKALVQELIHGTACYTQPDAAYKGHRNTMESEASRLLKGEVVVPRNAVGAIIGRGGEIIKNIARQTDCQIQFKKDDNPSSAERVAIIFARNTDDLYRATQMISNIVHSRDSYQSDHQTNDADEVSTIHVPVDKAGVVIGKRGETIKQINMESGAFCQLTEDTRYSDTLRIFRISGDPQQVEHAKRLIRQKLNDSPYGNTQRHDHYYNDSRMQTGMGYNDQPQWSYYNAQQYGRYPMQAPMPMHSGGLHNNCPQIMQSVLVPQQAQFLAMPTQVAQNNVANDKMDYSADWVQYYRALGMIDQAKAVEASIQVRELNK